MVPRHIKTVTDDRKAHAPYNFVELPSKVVEVTEASLPSGDRYYPHKDVELPRYTGRIECTLTTESPLYTRCGWTTDDFGEYGDKAFHELPSEIKLKRANFFIHPVTQRPIIPGSSLRGMLRTLVEIVSFSKVDRVSSDQRLFFRAVGSNPNKESWGREYKQYVRPELVKAGYLVRDGKLWFIRPAEVHQKRTFAWVRESSLDSAKLHLAEFNAEKPYEYEPQYIPISYTKVVEDTADRVGRLFAHDTDLPEVHSLKGMLVTSGNMKQGDESSPRRNHCIVFPADSNSKLLQIDNKAIEHYRKALTDFQKSSPFNKDWGVLKEGRPVFYYHDGKSNTVGFFGQSPNFRIPYSPSRNGHATTVRDFIPTHLRKLSSIDLADAIFGWVKQESEEEKLPSDFNKQYSQHSSRVSITDALYQTDKDGIWHSEKPVTPQILSEPKPSCFSHYLVQPDVEKLQLKHYASTPAEETGIRGHKLYWHKGNNHDFKLPQPKKVIGAEKKISEPNTQTTLIKPLKQGVTFKFDIYFENLSDVELGALLWVLDIAQDNQYRLSLGMGKPLGMGAVKITYNLYMNQRKERYKNLFDEEKWLTGYSSAPDSIQQYITEFDRYIRQEINARESSLKKVRRIKMFLAMLSWEEAPSSEQTRYMEIERDAKLQHIGTPKKGKVNEYADRPVLPTPLQIIGWDDDGDENNNPNSRNSGGGNSPKPDPHNPRNGDCPKPNPRNSSSNQSGKTAMELALERAQKKPKRK